MSLNKVASISRPNIYADRSNVSEMVCYDESIIIANKLLLKCTIQNGSYIPTQIISWNKLLLQLRNQQISNDRAEIKTRKISLPVPLRQENNEENDALPHPHPYFRRRSISSGAYKKHSSSVLLEVESPVGIVQNLNEKIEKKKEPKLEKQFYEQVEWVKREKSEYVSMETLKSFSQLKTYIQILLRVQQPFVVQIKVNRDNTITLIYQLIEKFQQQFMMVKIGTRHCLFLEPF